MNMNFDYIKNIDELKNYVTLHEVEDYHDYEIRNTFRDFDGVIEIKDYNKVIENSVLKIELEKIQRLKIMLEEVNTITLRESAFAEIDELEETNDREIMNRAMVRNIRARGLQVNNHDAIYLKNKEDESYNEVKSYFLEVGLPYPLNNNFDAIAKRLKKAIASKKQSFTTFRIIDLITDRRKNYLLVTNMTFNNERINKEIYKLFLPYTSMVNVEISALVTKKKMWGVSSFRDNRIVRLNDIY